MTSTTLLVGILEKFSTDSFARIEFGIVTSVLSKVLTLVERKPITSTFPS